MKKYEWERLKNQKKINRFRRHTEKIYSHYSTGCGGSFDEIICYELHDQPVNPRMQERSYSDGYSTGLTFKELAAKWGITVGFLGELIADHCRKLEGIKRSREKLADNGQMALQFSSNNLIEKVFGELVREHVPFQVAGQNIIILPKKIGEKFKSATSFDCKEVEIVSLFHLPREEANRIRRRHLGIEK